MHRYDYLTLYVNASGQYQTPAGRWGPVSELGDDGWELVSVVNDGDDLVAFFKRLKIYDTDASGQT
jgi:hypothetical protein